MLAGAVQLRFDATSHPHPAERIAAWANVMSLSVDVSVRPEDRDQFEARLNFYPFGPVLLVDSYATRQTVTRNKRTIARSGSEHVILDVFLEGGFTGVVGGHALAIAPGDVFMMDFRGTMRVGLSTCRYLGVVVPRPLFESHAGMKGVHGLRIDAASPEARLLCRLLSTLVDQAPDLTSERAAALGIGLIPLIGACIRTENSTVIEDRHVAAEPTLIRIGRYIERHAADPHLSAETLCKTFGLSRTALYRVCQPNGGVASLIRRRRTEIARILLVGGAQSPRTDEEIAQTSGFIGQRALKRALHDLYATTPLRLRQEAQDLHLAASQHRIEVSVLLDRHGS